MIGTQMSPARLYTYQNKMKQQRVIVTPYNSYASDTEERINAAIADGWRVVSVTAQHISTSSSQTARGGFFVVLEKDSSN
jgi:hypothetical protein